MRAAREEDQELADLTAREIEVLALLAQGKTNKDIADALVISTNTVKRHLKAIFGKLGVHRAAATAKAIGAGLSGPSSPEARPDCLRAAVPLDLVSSFENCRGISRALCSATCERLLTPRRRVYFAHLSTA